MVFEVHDESLATIGLMESIQRLGLRFFRKVLCGDGSNPCMVCAVVLSFPGHNFRLRHHLPCLAMRRRRFFCIRAMGYISRPADPPELGPLANSSPLLCH
jgi:hypothetical protein